MILTQKFKSIILITCMGVLFLILKIRLMDINGFNFYRFNNNITSINSQIDNNNYYSKRGIYKYSDSYKSPIYMSYRRRCDNISDIGDSISKYIDRIKIDLMSDAIGSNITPEQLTFINNNVDDEKYQRKFNKSISSNIGLDLYSRLINYRNSILALVENDSGINASILIEKENPFYKNSKSNWLLLKYGNIPVSAAIPLLSKLQMDIKITIAMVLKYFHDKFNSNDVEFDKNKIVVKPKKNYVLKGEYFDADIYLLNYSSNLPEGSGIMINGNNIKLSNGVGNYTVNADSLGKHIIKTTAVHKKSWSNENTKESDKYEYEVGTQSVFVTPELSKILYIGIENPISVASPGIDAKKIKLMTSGYGNASIKKLDNRNYLVKVTKETKEGEFCYITAFGLGRTDKKAYKVEQVPDPITLLGHKKSGQIYANDFKSLSQLNAIIQDFEYDVKCKVTGFNIIRIAKEKHLVKLSNEGFAFNHECRELAKQAVPGDVYCFEKVKARCLGDLTDRTISALVFNIK